MYLSNLKINWILILKSIDELILSNPSNNAGLHEASPLLLHQPCPFHTSFEGSQMKPYCRLDKYIFRIFMSLNIILYVYIDIYIHARLQYILLFSICVCVCVCVYNCFSQLCNTPKVDFLCSLFDHFNHSSLARILVYVQLFSATNNATISIFYESLCTI